MEPLIRAGLFAVGGFLGIVAVTLLQAAGLPPALAAACIVAPIAALYVVSVVRRWYP